ncbi:hypothetical protein CANINC_004392 [Pichia inconspicua]|uniref:N-terminal acetyltransferase A, auxiliary subunit n=1 Tax=Pichia inconspicua TaxID=52247 RepID=A0A4T0WW61_9ASCO|nr:hypothetical protein CANINC_004392 [[Candida] inconspicua]
MDATELQFRSALQDYEAKNYKKAIQTVDKILKKNPLHSQSYALKALITGFYHPNSPDNTDANELCNVNEDILKECDDLIEQAVKYGPSNSISAHLSALFYRQVKNYERAAHFYSTAYANNPNNKAILRDLSSCLSQMKNYKLLSKTRLDYLTAEPGYRANYSSTAIAYDLNDEYENSIKIIEQIEELVKDKLIDEDKHENSESLIYKMELYFKNGDYEVAVKEIESLLKSTEKFRCYDVSGLLELKYKALMKLENFKEAHIVIRKLLKRNPDNIIYYSNLVKCLGIEENVELKKKLFVKLATFYPKSDLPKFLPLTFLNGEDFKEHLTYYLTSLFKRGVPSLFSSIKSLYKDSKKSKIILEVAETLESMEKDITVSSWIKYFISQHYYKLKEYNDSMKKVDEAISISPDCIEFLMFKARILKHQKKLIDAANQMNDARLKDLQDRFINTKTVKYKLRADEIDEALKLAGLFTKNEDGDTPLKDLHVVQACWIISEYAEALDRAFRSKLLHFQDIEAKQLQLVDEENTHLLKKQIESYFGLALQRYLSIFKIYAEYYDDQFDFHFYAFRKGNLRAYNEMIDWASKLYQQPFIGRIYNDLMDLVFFSVEERKLLTDALDYSTTLNKRSKKDKKEEIKWKEEMLKIHKVYEKDTFGESLVQQVMKKDYSKIESIEKVVSHNKPETVQFLNGSFNYEMLQGKYVVALAQLRKMKEIAKQESETGERAQRTADNMVAKLNKFLETPTDDAKIESLKKIVKLGLMRL